MATSQAQREGFLALLDEFTALIRDTFLGAIAHIRSRTILSNLIARLERNDAEGAVQTIGLDTAAFNLMLDQIAAAYGAGGGKANDQLPILRDTEGFRINVRFDVRNPAAEAWLRSNGATLVREIVDDQVGMLRQILAEGQASGKSVRAIALDMIGKINKTTGAREGGAIGLTSVQEQWAKAYEAELQSLNRNALTRALRDRRYDKALLRAIESGKPIPADKVAKMATAYRNRLLQYRGETIARTETLTALNAGRDEAMRQAVASGAVPGNLVDQKWHTTMDGRERDSHASLNGQVVPFGQPFISGDGNRLRYPGDPQAPISEVANCRCSKTFLIRKAS